MIGFAIWDRRTIFFCHDFVKNRGGLINGLYNANKNIYEEFEKRLGKESASTIVETLEISIKKAIEEGQQQQKVSVLEELRKELASKYDIELIRKDLKIITIILLAVIIFLNQNSLEFIVRVLGVMK